MGHEKASYGPEPEDSSSWLDKLLAEVGAEIDPSRVHVVGFLSKDLYRSVLHVSKVHVYLTYPFILSWSLLEVMAIGVPIAASNTAPIKEFIKDGKTGLLFDFFDTHDLIKTVIKQLDEKQSQLDKQSKNARTLVVNNFQQKEYVEQLYNLIEAVVDSKA